MNRWIIVASLNSCGMASFLHSVSFSATGGPPVLYISAGIAFDPGALPDDRSFIAFTVSETVGNSSSNSSSSWCLGRAVAWDYGIPWTFLLPFLQSTCASVLIASSLIDYIPTVRLLDDGRLYPYC